MARQFALLVVLTFSGCQGCVAPLADGMPEGEGCSKCHGNADNAAPPHAVVLGKTTLDVEVGSHQLHLRGGFAQRPVGCEECHLVPLKPEDEGHIDLASPEQPSTPADVIFGGLATLHVSPSWNREQATCSNSYCHGTTLQGGTRTVPTWTLAEEPDYLQVLSAQTCGGCHGAPPPPPHPAGAQCELCHATTVSAGFLVVPGGTHLDGKLDVATGCSSCHGSAENSAPPSDLRGGRETTAPGVGAHQAHLANSALRLAVGCPECHVVPATLGAAGHVDSPWPAELTFGPLARADGGLTPRFDGTSCSNSYCHGATLSGGSATAPVWTRVDGTQKQCGSCHGAPPPLPHPPSAQCAACHPTTVFPDGGIDVDGGHHLDGVLDVGTACNVCHGSDSNAAPPRDLSGRGDTAAPGVGAHQSHLGPSTWRRLIVCDDCHLVPGDAGDPGHLDTALPAELTWSALARGDGGVPTWASATQTCANYCHGAATRGGTNKTPRWTQVDGTQAACGTCHGAPPQNHFSGSCEFCHPTMGPGMTIALPERHIDGVVDVTLGGACGSCHPVPPQTGAHAAHYGDVSDPPRATYGDERQLGDYFDGGQPFYMFGCGTCHPVAPTSHLNGTVDVDLVSTDGGTLKVRNGPGASWSASNGTCSNVYCHSTGQAQPAYTTSPSWTSTAGTRCDSCHGNPPAYPSGGAGTPTANVHLVMADDGYEFGHFGGLPGPWHSSFHGGGGAGAITCQACHSATTNPQHTGPSGFYWLNTTGTYRLDGGALNYSCTGCHTADAGVSAMGAGGVLPLKHVNGIRDLEFDRRMLLPTGYSGGGVTPAPTAPFWVRASSGMRNYTLADAGYDPTTKTCSNVSCHGEQTSVQWGLTPVGWATCNTCHQF